MSQQSVSRHHADWLSLVEVSGPFVSLPVLMRVFPQGLEPRDPTQAKALRGAYEEWQDNPAAPGNHRAWVMHVLTTVLGYTPEQIAEGQTLPAGLEAKMPEMGETLRPDFAVVGTSGSDTVGQSQLLIANYMAEQALDKPVIGKHWKATPATRMMELLHRSGVPLGLVTNGGHWMMVYAPRGETTGYASWYGALWLDESITLRAFHSLFGVRRFFGVSADNTLLAMLKESANDQQEVTDQLGYQVREAVEVLVKSVDALDRENHRALLKDLPETVLYDAALTIMMRLVFLFAAEERGLLHLGKPLYDNNYAVSTLHEQLQEVADQHGEEVLERRSDAWTRLLATFRAVHGGIQHQDLLMPAYGGSLFDPDRYPFLEGRVAQSSWRISPAEPLAVNNRVVLHLLNSLQRLRVKVPGGGPAESRRVSFRALGVEQIGNVYEGLLDRTAVRASEPVLGVKGARDKEGDIPLATLESLSAHGRDKLLEFLKEETGRSLSVLRNALDEVSLLDDHRLLIACGHDKKLLERIRPFANLICEDSFGRPLVTLNDSIYVTTATTRRSTGTHYTPPSLTEPIVKYTLEPLVYEGPAEGLPREQWKLKAPRAILDLKVCDMAMGSGAFLVQACRYIAERLVESWEYLESQHPGEVLITPEGVLSSGSPSERLVPADLNERVAIARRVVADRCLYGVDINPMAVEMAKLSLWLITVQRDRPFTFLDHALKCGDSLLGVSSVKQINSFSLRPNERQVTFATANLPRYVEEAAAKRRILEELPSNDHTQIETKNRLHSEAEAATAAVKALADCLIAFEMSGPDGGAYNQQRTAAADHAEVAMRNPLSDFQVYASEQLTGRRTFHWVMEFPEIFEKDGFDALIGNPPFLGGQKITGSFGTQYRNFLIANVANGQAGSANLCAYFLLRAHELLKENGYAGILCPDTIAQGVTREVCLDALVTNRCAFLRAISSRVWPGQATVYFAIVWLRKGTWHGTVILDDNIVQGITSYLCATAAVSGSPKTLAALCRKSFQGTIVLGQGFLISPAEAKSVFEGNPRNRMVVQPFLTGEDLNATPSHEPTRWVINFFDWPLQRTHSGHWANSTKAEQEVWLRSGVVPSDYPAPVAADFPECLAIVEEYVKPERTRKKPNGEFVLRKPLPQKWWIYAEKRPALYSTIAGMDQVIVISRITNFVAFAMLPSNIVFSDRLAVIAFSDFGHFATLQSSLHYHWAWKYSVTNLSMLSYSPTSCFETFPFPKDVCVLEKQGHSYSQYRSETMRESQRGLTDIYNRFHSSLENSEHIRELRALHVAMDQAVVAAYGWCDLELGHGFYETKQGIRFTISEAARSAVLDRLLALNHQRHAEEEAEKTAKAISAPVKRGRKKKDGADKLTFDLL